MHVESEGRGFEHRRWRFF